MPTAIIVGCPVYDFWFSDPQLFWTFLDAYKRQKKVEDKMWQARTNMSSWLQGRYVAEAINACFAKNGRYPIKPLHLLTDDGMDSDGNEDKPAADSVQESIRAQSIQIDALLANKGKPPPETIGPKRI